MGRGDLQDLHPTEAGGKAVCGLFGCPKRRLRRWRWMRRGMFMRRGWGRSRWVAAAAASVAGDGNVGVTITFSQPGSANAARTNTLIPDGSEIYRIAADGSSEKLLTLKDDVVYGLAFRNGSLLAATGNRGGCIAWIRRWRGSLRMWRTWRLRRGWRLRRCRVGCWWGPATAARCIRWRIRSAKNATYTSEVFDAQGFSQWGRVELRPESWKGVELFVRSGNVQSALMGWSAWTPVGADGEVTVPGGAVCAVEGGAASGRELGPGGAELSGEESAPVVDEMVVQAGARVAASGGSSAEQDGAGDVSPGGWNVQAMYFNVDASTPADGAEG